MDNSFDTIIDLFDENIDYEDIIKKDENESYYIAKAEKILSQIDNNENYFIFLKIFLKKYNSLDKDKKKQIENMINIKIKVDDKEPPKKVIIKKKKESKKPKLNNFDDY